MTRPETLYATSGGVQIAYQVTGSGPIDIVWAPGTVSHLDLDWEWPGRAHYIERLSSFSRLIRFDKRGTGLSDRPTNAATLDERIDDIRAVMDAAGSQKAVIYGVSEGGSMACLFATTYPERTLRLVLWGVQARWTQTADYPWGLTAQEQQRVVEEARQKGVTLSYLLGPGAGVGDAATREYLEWYVKYARAAGSPAAVAALESMNADVDVRGILPLVRVPTLVMNRTGDPVAPAKAGRFLAERIPGAKFVEWPGNTHSVYDIGDEVAATVEAFVQGSTTSPPSGRVLATFLFVDIVGSTEILGRLGDAGWKQTLVRAEEASERAVAAFRGRVVKDTGDGFLAMFDGPSRAIQCAQQVRKDYLALGLPTRAGLHTGECELRGKDVGGMALHVTARVMGAAGPGEILVSSTLRDLVAGGGFSFDKRGPMRLKGLPEEVTVFVAS